MSAFIRKPDSLGYKPLKESHIQDSLALPKIVVKDFADYLSTIKIV